MTVHVSSLCARFLTDFKQFCTFLKIFEPHKCTCMHVCMCMHVHVYNLCERKPVKRGEECLA